MSGILANLVLDVSLLFCAVGGICSAAAVFILPEKMVKSLFVGGFFLGFVTGQAGLRKEDPIIESSPNIERKGNVTVTGRVVEIDVRLNGTMLLVLERAAYKECKECSWEPIPRKIEVMLFEGRYSVDPGDALLMRGTLAPVYPGRVFAGGRSVRERTARVTIYKACSLAKLGGRGEENDLVKSTGFRLRRRVEKLLFDLPGGKGRSFLWGILLGPAANLPPDMRDHFASLGLSHLLAISGLHMAILGGTVFFLFSFLSKSIPFAASRCYWSKPAALATFPVVFFHWIIVGGRPSTTRAAVMLSAFLGAKLFSRPSSAKNALALGAVGLLSWRPEWVRNPGFQMSFTVVACLCICSEIVHGEKENNPDWMRKRVFLERIRNVLWNLTWVSTAAGLAVGGLVAYHFGRIAVWSLPANLLAVPVVCWIILPIAFTGIIVGLLWPSLGGAILLGVSAVSSEFVRVVEYTATILPQVHVTISGAEVGFYYSVLFFLLLWKHPSTSWRKGGWAAGIMAGLLVISVVFPIRGRVDNPKISFLNIGQGEAILIELPTGHNILVDTGDGFEKGVDHCTKTLLPFLRQRKVKRLDLLIITHPHMDHMGGAVCLIGALDVRELWTNGETDPDGYISFVIETAKRRGVRVQEAESRVYGETLLELMHPLGRNKQRAEPMPMLDMNDNSLVFMLIHPNGKILLTGDIGEEAESILETAAIKADVLKVPHHGSRGSSKRTFLEKVSPRYAVVCARGPPPGFRDMEARYKSLGIKLFSTWRSGVITVVLKKEGIQTSFEFR